MKQKILSLLEDIEADQIEIVKRLMEIKDLMTNPDGSLK